VGGLFSREFVTAPGASTESSISEASVGVNPVVLGVRARLTIRTMRPTCRIAVQTLCRHGARQGCAEREVVRKYPLACAHPFISGLGRISELLSGFAITAVVLTAAHRALLLQALLARICFWRRLPPDLESGGIVRHAGVRFLCDRRIRHSLRLTDRRFLLESSLPPHTEFEGQTRRRSLRRFPAEVMWWKFRSINWPSPPAFFDHPVFLRHFFRTRRAL